MVRRTRITVLVTLALLNAFTIAAAAAVAAMLPGRLALVQPARVVLPATVHPAPVLAAGGLSGPLPAGRSLGSRLSALLASGVLGSSVGAVVADPLSGQVLFSAAGSAPSAPASTAKLATAVAALAAEGPGARFTTRVVQGGAPGQIVLVGGGDPTLTASAPPRSDYPQPATLAALAAQTARALTAEHRSAVQLSYDTSLFTGPALAPGWTMDYVTTGNVTPITSLEVDQGRLTASGKPEDADDPDNFLPRSLTPAADAARVFATLLARRGIRVARRVSAGTAPSQAVAVASVSSPPLSSVVQWMLSESNNVIAENLARQVALAAGAPASFSGAAAATQEVLRRAGAAGGIHLVDGSGLSPDDRISPDALVGLVRLAASTGHPGLRPAITGMPVAGFSGTLAAGQSVFGGLGAYAPGVVRAKTGNLDTVVTMAGLADDRDGRLLAFAFMAGRVPAGDLQAAATVIVRLAATVASCGCR